MQILAISGSLRAQSSNTSALIAAAMLAPAGMEVVLYPGLAELPHFNPDLDLDLDSPPDIVRSLRRLIGQSDGLLICSPEYAHGSARAVRASDRRGGGRVATRSQN